MRKFALPPVGGRWAVSSDLGYAAAQDDLGVIRTLFNCGGGPFGGDELACVGAGKQAEVGRLTADVHQEVARFRLLGKLPGKPFTEVFAGPDGKHLLARRIDGFYALPVGFPVTVLSWSGNH